MLFKILISFNWLCSIGFSPRETWFIGYVCRRSRNLCRYRTHNMYYTAIELYPEQIQSIPHVHCLFSNNNNNIYSYLLPCFFRTKILHVFLIPVSKLASHMGYYEHSNELSGETFSWSVDKLATFPERFCASEFYIYFAWKRLLSRGTQ